MENALQKDFIQGSLFEENFLVRNIGVLAHSPDIALTELVANAWDAGATEVVISIPEERGEKLVVEDNGTGLTEEQFSSRWMRLGYDRLKKQGKKVVFPPGVEGNRLAYGRNGVGRHGLLCFGKEYTVTTRCDGVENRFVITTDNEQNPFVVKEHTSNNRSAGTGTKLEVTVEHNLPDAERILKVISARFLHDPMFVVKVNDETVELEEHAGLIDKRVVKVAENISLEMFFVDSQKAARRNLYQGIAFWQSGRLVGEPSWILGKESIIDGRFRLAKQYTVVVKTDDLGDFVNEDWTGFKSDPVIQPVYDAVNAYVMEVFGKLSTENIEETKKQVKAQLGDVVKGLSPLARYEMDEAIEEVVKKHPTARQDSVALVAETVANLSKTRSGVELLNKISALSDEDRDGLNRLLDEWTIKDALCVLDEIDKRISVIEAIRKLGSDRSIDELKVLHPLVTDARWLFGPEFDSPEYVSNQQLRTVVKDLFKTKIKDDVFDNPRKRPDLVVVGDSTFSITGTANFNEAGLSQIDRILLIELKRGGFEITRDERNQATGYVEDFMNCGSLIGDPLINAFVVGDKISNKIEPTTAIRNKSDVEKGKVRVTTYSQLVDSASKRLFNLRDQIEQRYDGVSGVDLYRKSQQGSLNLQDRAVVADLENNDDSIQF